MIKVQKDRLGNEIKAGDDVVIMNDSEDDFDFYKLGAIGTILTDGSDDDVLIRFHTGEYEIDADGDYEWWAKLIDIELVDTKQERQKDRLGKDIKIGDKVLYIRNNKTSYNIYKCRVKSFTPKMVELHFDSYPDEGVGYVPWYVKSLKKSSSLILHDWDED